MKIIFKTDCAQTKLIQTGITCKKSPLKSLLNSTCLWSRVQIAIKKKQKYFLLPDHQLARNCILVFHFLGKDKKEIKANF